MSERLEIRVMTVEAMSKDEAFVEIRKLLVEMFELEESAVTLGAGVFEELDLDSIDAIDLVAKLHEMTGRRVTEAEMRAVRTVEDIVDIVLKPGEPEENPAEGATSGESSVSPSADVPR